MERDVWMREYKRLTTAYGKPTNAEQARVYFEALAGYEDGEIVSAVREAMTRCKFFPTVADIIACCGPTRGDEADPLFPQFRQWQKVNAHDPQMPSITFVMFRNYIEGMRA